MSNPKISVCIPVYNGERFISEAITSVLNQSFGNFELIIVDNHSTDNTVKIIQSFTDERIRFFQNPENIGLIPNWNMALSKCSGDYIKILPADDLIYSDCLKLQSAVLDADKEGRISMVCGRRNIINDKGKVLFSRGFSKKEMQVSGVTAINRNIRSGGNIIGEGGSILFRRSILLKTGLFNSDIFYVLDLDMWYKILLYGDLYALPQLAGAFRISSVSASTVVKNTQRADIKKFLTKIRRQKEYHVSFYSFAMCLLKVRMNTIAKKLLYRFLLK